MVSSSERGPRGMLIVLEGLDKAGKTTQCARLAQNLTAHGSNVKTTRFPNRATTIGQMINRYLEGRTEQEDHAIHLLFTANRWEAAEQIKAWIADGHIVIIDRYYYSGCVYSAAKQNKDLDLNWARQPEVGLPRPDFCIFLDISAEDAAKRGGYGGEKYENKSMQSRIRELYKQLLESPDGDDFVVINAGKTTEDVEKEMLNAVIERMQRNNFLSPLRQVLPWPSLDVRS
ncbi:MAG: hypothetical protein M1819_002947 [Sarea resinae]|nr:MAG: hypothetical protein M1819_002947 [Sarea resinae]